MSAPPIPPHAVTLGAQIEAVKAAIDMADELIGDKATATRWSVEHVNALRGALLTMQRVARPPIDQRDRIWR